MAQSDLPPHQQEAYEEKNVHEVYQQIASHFSSTRYKPWPIAKEFLQSLSPGSVGLDVGCGNGKYLPVNKDVFIIGSDRSSNLTKIALSHQPHSAIVADILNLPHPDSFFDFAISIAVIHHLSTPDRRVQAIREILRTLKPSSSSGASSGTSSSGAFSSGGCSGEEETPGGKALIYVWALEQKSSRRGWDTGDAQDRMVPWVMRGSSEEEEPKVFQRYYHLYEADELKRDIERAGGRVLESGYERDNWWAIATPIGQRK